MRHDIQSRTGTDQDRIENRVSGMPRHMGIYRDKTEMALGSEPSLLPVQSTAMPAGTTYFSG
jgi:hypothetical protein